MNVASLILRNLLRNKIRFGLSVAAIGVAFTVFGVLRPMQRLFDGPIDGTQANRLIVTNRASQLRPLPISHTDTIQTVPGVVAVSYFTFIRGAFQSPANPVAVVATDTNKFPGIMGEAVFSRPEDVKTWLADPTGAAVGRDLAERFDWHVGDLIPIQTLGLVRRDGGSTWTFRVDAIFTSADPSRSPTSIIIDYQSFDEQRAFDRHSVGFYLVVAANADEAASVAQRIDSAFANSPAETSTVTQRAFAQTLLRQIGDFQAVALPALVVIFATLLLSATLTMSQSISERGAEIAVMKTLGYSRVFILSTILLEGITLMALGWLLGAGLSYVTLAVISSQSITLLSGLSIYWSDLAVGLALALILGIVVSTQPGLRAARRSIVAGLAEAV